MSEQTANASKKPRLGRGLGSLLGGSLDSTIVAPEAPKPTAQVVAGSAAVQAKGQEATKTAIQTTHNQQQPSIPPEARIWKIAVDKLHPNEYQPRMKFNRETIQELAESIKQKGILQPIVARRHATGALEIISGERRWRAAQAAGLHEVPVILKSVSDQESLELAIIENIQREDLNPIDEADAYRRLAADFSLTQQQIAEKVGKDRATVANAMRLLNLPKDIQELVSAGELSVGHAKTLLSVTEPTVQKEMALEAIKKKLSVRALEKMVANTSSKSANIDNTNSPRADIHIKSLEDDLQKKLGTKVTIDYKEGKGKLAIHFYSNDALSEIVEKINNI